MSSYLKLIRSGAMADVAEAIELDPALAEYRDPQGVSALLWAIYAGQPQVRDFLAARMVEHGVALDLFEAAALGDAVRLAAILESDTDAVSLVSGDGWTPLHLAAAFGSPAAVAVLLAGGAQVGAVSLNAQRNQPLHAVLAVGRNPETITLLLEHGADANACQAGDFTAIFAAAAANRRDLAELLLLHGAKAHHVTDQGKTAAAFARERGHDELADWLDSQPA